MQSYTLSNGVTIVNVTPHDLTFATASGDLETAPKSGVIISATATEVTEVENGVTFSTPTFIPSAEGEQALAAISAACPGAIVVGSLIAAQAYRGRVVGMVAAPGYERVAPAEKRMDPAKFARFN